jgi:regulatory protein
MHRNPSDKPPDPATELERCYAAALRILGFRWNSVEELRRKLQRKGHPVEAVDATLARLLDEKWLDDERFASAFVRDRRRRRLGDRRVAAELCASGVDDETARRVLGENRDPEQQREALTALCEKKIRLLARRHGHEFLSTEDGRRKLSAYLFQQGYESGLVLEVMRETVKKFLSC